MFFYNLIDIFTRAREHQPLTPAERAFLRAFDGFIVLLFLTAVTAAAPIIQSYTSGQSFDWSALIKAVAVAFFEVIGMALVKLWKAQGDNGVPVQSGGPATVPDGPADTGVPAGSTPGTSAATSAAKTVPSDPIAAQVGRLPVSPAPTALLGTPPSPPMPYTLDHDLLEGTLPAIPHAPINDASRAAPGLVVFDNGSRTVS